MTDDKSQTGGQDRKRISLGEDYEVRDWSEKFGVSEERLRAAVAKVGHMAEDVERELTFRMKRAAEAYHFELAARLRDQLAAVKKIAEKQNIVTGAGDQDAIGMARSARISLPARKTSFNRLVEPGAVPVFTSSPCTT